VVRPAWAYSRRRRFSRRLTDRGKEVRIINHEPGNTNRMQGAADQGERATYRKTLLVKGLRGFPVWLNLNLPHRRVQTRMPGGMAVAPLRYTGSPCADPVQELQKHAA